MNNRKLNELLDDVTASVRSEKLDDATVMAAGDRVWSRLNHEQTAAQAGVVTVEHLRNCDDFQSLIPAYLGGYLSSARTMLLEDHTRECVPCRKALKEARHGHATQKAEREVMKAKPSWLQVPAMRWALAAAIVIGFGLFAWPFVSRLMNSVGTLTAIVEAASGNVYRVAENKTQALKAGEQLVKGERLRTAKDAGAVLKLSDGSTIETRERSEFSVNQTADGITINLERGNIIVQAAKQGSQHLYVATPDSLVSVTGTTFSVNSGTKGSRVSVIEGEVQVNRAGSKQVLHPGEQLATHTSIAPVPVKDEVAWSRDAQRYRQLLDTVKRDINARVAMPGNRYSTRLLDLMPEGTIFYAAIPNLSQTLAQADAILQENIQKNPELREWYEKDQAAGKGAKGKGFDEVLKKVTEFGQFIGQEIAIGAESDGVLALADLTNPTGFRAYLDQQLASLDSEGKDKLRGVIVDDPLTSNLPRKQRSKDGDNSDHQLLIWINNDVLAASTDLATLQNVATSLKSNAASRFNATPFHARLADVYREGAGLVIGADLARLINHSLASEKHSEHDAAILNQLGVTRLQHFIAELKDVNGQPQNRAVVTYEPAQHGLAAWLAAPGPMGALQFISPDANVVGSFVVQNPTALYDDVMNMLKTAEPEAWQELNNLQTQHSISLREDFAAKLGGEFAVAVDGPIIPTPSWKVVVEVNNPEGLQQSLEHAVSELNNELAQKGHPQLVWENAQSGGRTFYRLKPATGMGEVNYAFAYGYLIAAPSRTLVENAIKYRESGYTLTQSAKFKAALPADKQANFSAMFYYNVAPILAPIAKKMGTVKGLPAEGRSVLNKLATDKAALGYVYALGDRMILSVNTEDGPIGLTPSSLLGMPGGLGLRQIFKGVGN